MTSLIVTLFLAAVILAPGLFKLRRRPRLRWAIIGAVLVVYFTLTWLATRQGGPFG